MKKGLVLVAALGLIALVAIPVLAQKVKKLLDEQMMNLRSSIKKYGTTVRVLSIFPLPLYLSG